MKAILGTSSKGWLLTPFSDVSNNALQVGSSGSVNDQQISYEYGVAPVLYLNSELSIKSGTGSSSDPYQLNV